MSSFGFHRRIVVKTLVTRGGTAGAYIAEVNTGAGNTSLVLAAALWAGLLGLTANAFLVWCERRVLRWHHASLEPA